MRRRLAGLPLLAVLGVGALSASTAWAHASLESSSPAANAVLEVGPTSIVLDFDEDVEPALTSITVYGADGVEVAVGDVAVGTDSTVLEAAVTDGSTLADGPYAVVWRTTSADGHVVDGSFAFQIGTAAAAAPDELLESVTAGDESRVDEISLAVGRFFSLLGAMVLVGGSWWSSRRGGALLRQRSTAVVLGLASWSLLAGSIDAYGAWVSSVGADLSGVLHSSTGRMLLARAILAAVLLVMGVRRWPRLRAVLLILLLVTFSASGHPNVLEPWPLWIVVDVVHLAGGAVWLGGIAVLVALRSAGRDDRDVEDVARTFSTVATIAMPVVVVTGVAQTLRIAGGLSDVSATDWGRLLLAKVVVVTVVLGVAGAARWLVQHEGVWSLRRTLVVEVIAGVLVVGLVSVMVGEAPRPAVAAAPFDATLSANGVIVAVAVSPGSVGSNEVHFVVTPPGGALAPVSELTARVSLESADIVDAPVTVVREGPDHFSGTVTFTQSGEWTLDVIVSLDGVSETLVSTSVTVP